ncbi:MarR family winged helix-turn-helix transcriptional regulator [Chloroflexota bacterium]
MKICKDDHYDIWWLISQVHHSLLELRDKELKKHHITGWQAQVLFLVKLFGKKATPTNISYWMFRRPNTISELLDRMESQGLIKRVRDLKHRGMVRVELTEKGTKIYNYANARISIHNVMDFLTEEECQILISCLKRMRDKTYKALGVNRSLSFP